MLFTPWLRRGSVLDLNPEFLMKSGIELLLLDRDNTIYHIEQGVIPKDVQTWCEQCKNTGIKLAIVSNNSHAKELAQDAELLDLPVFAPAFKPLPHMIKKALASFGIKASSCALVGDQIITDCMAARLAHIRPIIVNPLSTSDFWWTKLSRALGNKFARPPEISSNRGLCEGSAA